MCFGSREKPSVMFMSNWEGMGWGESRVKDEKYVSDVLCGLWVERECLGEFNDVLWAEKESKKPGIYHKCMIDCGRACGVAAIWFV